MEQNMSKKIFSSICILLVAVICMCIISPIAADPANHEEAINSLDEKIETVLKLTEISTLASAGVSALPGDMATPIADKLAEFAQDFLLILCVLFSEKYLISIIGLASFRFLLPISCVLLIVSQFWNTHQMRRLGIKMAVLGLALYMAIPFSISISDKVYDTYEVSIQETIASAQELADETEALEIQEQSSGVFHIVENISNAAHELINKASHIVNRFLETVAIMIVTSCVIPLMGLLLFLWVVNSITGTDVFSHLIPMGRKLGRFRFVPSGTHPNSNE